MSLIVPLIGVGISAGSHILENLLSRASKQGTASKVTNDFSNVLNALKLKAPSESNFISRTDSVNAIGELSDNDKLLQDKFIQALRQSPQLNQIRESVAHLDPTTPLLLVKNNNGNFSLKIPEGKYNEIDIPLRTDNLTGLAYKACQVSSEGTQALKICNLGDVFTNKISEGPTMAQILRRF